MNITKTTMMSKSSIMKCGRVQLV